MAIFVTVIGFLAISIWQYHRLTTQVASHTLDTAPNPYVGTNSPAPLIGHRTDISDFAGSAIKAGIGDVTGDKANEIILVDSEQLRVVTPSGREIAATSVPGGIHVLTVADLNNDGKAEIYAGWGTTREHRQATARVNTYQLQNNTLTEEVILEPETTRHDVVAIIPQQDTSSLFLAYFESKYFVRASTAQRRSSSWEITTGTSTRMATSYGHGDVDGDGSKDLVVGRIYGDDINTDGDAYVLMADSQKISIPTTRGVRALALADSDGDGKDEVFMGDGWHANYGQNAEGLLTQANQTTQEFESKVLKHGGHGVFTNAIVPALIDDTVIILTAGNRHTQAFKHENNQWHEVTIATAVSDVVTGDLDGIPGDEILVVGEREDVQAVGKSAIINLQGITWP